MQTIFGKIMKEKAPKKKTAGCFPIHDAGCTVYVDRFTLNLVLNVVRGYSRTVGPYSRVLNLVRDLGMPDLNLVLVRYGGTVCSCTGVY